MATRARYMCGWPILKRRRLVGAGSTPVFGGVISTMTAPKSFAIRLIVVVGPAPVVADGERPRDRGRAPTRPAFEPGGAGSLT
jgi:hypothetical protein